MAGPGLLSATLRSPTLALAGRVEGWKPLCTIVCLGFIFNAQIACTVNCLSSVLFNSTMGVRLICSHNMMLSCAQGSQCQAPRVGGRGAHAALGIPGTLASLLAAHHPSRRPTREESPWCGPANPPGHLCFHRPYRSRSCYVPMAAGCPVQGRGNMHALGGAL